MIYPSGHISSFVYLPIWISSGATVILLVKLDEELCFQSIEKYKINLLPTYPAMGRKLVRGELADKYDLSSIKMIITGEAAFDGKVFEAIVKKYNVLFRESKQKFHLTTSQIFKVHMKSTDYM